MRGYNDAGTPEEIEAVMIRGQMTDVSDGSEDSKLILYTYGGGSQKASLSLEGLSATFAGQVNVTSDIFLNPDYVNANEYLYLRKHQSGDGGIIFQSKTSGGSTQSDFQIRNQGTTGDLKFYAYGLAGEALILDRENGNATFAGNIITESGTVLVGGSAGQATTSGTGTLQVLGTGHSDSLFTIAKFKADASAPSINFLKSRHATIGSNTIVQDDDNLGEIVFAAADGNDFTSYAAKIMVSRWNTRTR